MLTFTKTSSNVRVHDNSRISTILPAYLPKSTSYEFMTRKSELCIFNYVAKSRIAITYLSSKLKVISSNTSSLSKQDSLYNNQQLVN